MAASGEDSIGTSCMIAQPFRFMAPAGPSIMALLANFFALFLLLGCSEDPFDSTPTRPARTPSSACSPACTGNLFCYEDEGWCDSPPCASCYPRDCPAANPVQSCVDGAVCDETSGQCTFVYTCDPSCGSGTHCVGGHCVPDYTSTNVCDPLDRCRRLCGANDPACLTACDLDRSPTCTTCVESLSRCENQEGCFGSATGCCSENYCACFPSASGCGGRPCDACMEQCTTDGVTNTPCFNNCANTTAACATCLAPMTGDPECRQNPPPARCEALFNECVTP